MTFQGELYPLSQPQKSIWYLEKMYPNTSMNNVAGTLRLKHHVDFAILEQAINLFIQKNDAMRIHITEEDGEPKQYIAEYVPVKFDYFDFSKDNGLNDLFKWDEEQTKKPFKLTNSALYYFAMLKISDTEGGFYIKTHHFISDAWSMSILGSQIAEYYSAICTSNEISGDNNPSYLDILSEEEKYLSSERLKKDQYYWDKKFQDCPEPVRLKPRSSNQISTKARRKTLLTPVKFSNKLRQHCEEYKVSPFTLFLAALSMYINRTLAVDDIILGTTILNRSNMREKKTFGMFASIGAPMRIRLNNVIDFNTFVDNMTKESISILRHQKYPYNFLLRDLNEKHNVSGSLFDIVLSYQNSKFQKEKSVEDYSTRWHFTGHQIESLIININDREDEGCLIIDYDYLIDVFNIKEIEFIHQHIISLLWHALDNPFKPISKLEMLSEREKQKILSSFNHTEADFPEDKLLHQFFMEQAQKTPDQTAVIYEDIYLSYKAIDERSNQLARVLRKKGICPDHVVAISVYRSPEMIIGLMAILKAGAAYLPIDPQYPDDRIKYMLEDSGANILLTQSHLMDHLNLEAELININDDTIFREDSSPLVFVNTPRDLAYIIYTSGSTGKPKGVMIEHRSIVNRINWMQKKYPISEESTILQKTPFTFDVSVWELFWWSFVGSKVCMLEPGGEKDPEVIIKSIEKNHITTMHFVPSMLSIFLDYVETRNSVNRLRSLQQVFASGEALSVIQTDTFNRLLNAHNETELYNLYGPTEAAVDVSYFDCSPKVSLKTVPIGKPIDNIRLYILDKNKNLLPVGIPGELYIGGVGVARGYINNPTLTTERFIPDPFLPGEIIYRTGDRVRWFPEGDIEYLGRIDFQVKIKGFRIELGEIENRLMQHDLVKETVVVGVPHHENHYLCAYIVPNQETVSIAELKAHLSKTLPDYMVPSYFVFLPTIPLSSNGKVDRKALPMPDFSNQSEKEYVAPEGPLEIALASIWSNILGMEQVSVTDNFFNLGGDSLRAIAMIMEVHKKLNIDLPVKEVFRLPTIRQLGEHLSSAKPNNYTPIPNLKEKDYYPLSSAQNRLFVLKQMEANDTSYNMPGAFLIEGQIDKQKVQAVFQALISRQESLRTSFAFKDGQPIQIIHEKISFEMTCINAQESEIDSIIASFIRPFDLSQDVLLRVCLVKLKASRHLLLFDMHHIISDGTSINLLVKEFTELYRANALPELKTSYKDFASWHNALIQSNALKEQEKYWLNLFSDEIPMLNMPTDYPRPARKSFRGKRLSFEIEAKLTAKLKQLSIDSGATLYMLMLSSYYVLLSKYTGQEDIVVGTPVEGRLHSELQNLIGMFVSTLAIRNYPQGEKTFLQFLQEVRENLLQAFENQEYPFEKLVDKLKVKRDLGRNPLFDTVFIQQNVDLTQIKVNDVTFTQYPFDSKSSKFDITLEAYDRGDHIDLIAEYCTDLFEETTIRNLIQHYINLLSDVVQNPSLPLSELNMLSAKEVQHLLYDLNDTDASFPRTKTLQALFEEQVTKTPDHIAVVFKEEAITYRELNNKSNQVARLLREKGICPDEIIGISMSRSIEMIIGILGILKAGGAYLPIDPDYPIDRITYMLEQSDAKLLLTQSRFLTQFHFPITLINIDDKSIYIRDTSNLDPVSHPADLAYIIFTSGSTGNPKGVMIEHRNVVRLLFNDHFPFKFSDQDVWTMFHSFCFDFSVWEMYGALLYGGKLVIVSTEDAIDTNQFLKILKKEHVTVLNQTPSAFYNLINEDLHCLDSSLTLRYVIFGGEALKPSLLESFYEKYPFTSLINMYGITETTVHVTFKELTADDISKNISNIGLPIPTLKTYILDQHQKLQPIGVPGELCVGGLGVARGYLKNPDLTSEKFISNPFSDHEKLYRSGDLARVLPCGELEYLGRIDNQVKIRGYRIELGEIEADLMKHPDISEAIVIPHENYSGEKKLYSYYVATRELGLTELRSFLQQRLPDYMIPSYFLQLEKFPLNKNGKIDRPRLPKNEMVINLTDDYIAPQNEVEEFFAKVWTEVLELTTIGIHDDFFDLGGDSLNAIKVMLRIRETYPSLSLVDLYSNPTISKLATKAASEMEKSEKLLLNLTPNQTEAKTNIICFPYGGGNAIAYKELSEAVCRRSDSHAVYSVNLPGHDIGDQRAFLSVEDVCMKLVNEIKNDLTGDLILYGHCVGTALLLETARLLEMEGINITSCFVGGICPPLHVKHYGSFFDPWKLYSDGKIIDYLNQIGFNKAVIDDDYAEIMVRAFRHDVRNYYRYFYHHNVKKLPKLSIPLHCMIGEKDKTTKDYLKRHRHWNHYASGVKIKVMKNADHYFISSHADELASIIVQQTDSTSKE